MLRFADGRVDENKQGFCENDDVTSGGYRGALPHQILGKQNGEGRQAARA